MTDTKFKEKLEKEKTHSIPVEKPKPLRELQWEIAKKIIQDRFHSDDD